MRRDLCATAFVLDTLREIYGQQHSSDGGGPAYMVDGDGDFEGGTRREYGRAQRHYKFGESRGGTHP